MRSGPSYGIVRAMPAAPAAMRQLADLRDQLARVERIRLRIIGGEGLKLADVMLLVDSAKAGIAAEMRTAKARLRAARAA